jgi:hypothetical protein
MINYLYSFSLQLQPEVELLRTLAARKEGETYLRRASKLDRW